MRRPLLQPQQRVAGSTQGQASDPITPLLLSPADSTTAGEPLVLPRGFCLCGCEMEGFCPSRPPRVLSYSPQSWHPWWPSSPPTPTSDHPACSAGPPQGGAGCRQRPGGSAHSPLVLDVFVDHAGDEHGHQGIVPGGDKHKGQAEAHAQEGQCPGPEGRAESGQDQEGPRPQPGPCPGGPVRSQVGGPRWEVPGGWSGHWVGDPGPVPPQPHNLPPHSVSSRSTYPGSPGLIQNEAPGLPRASRVRGVAHQ